MIEHVLLLSALSTLGVLSFGFFLGLKRATEADQITSYRLITGSICKHSTVWTGKGKHLSSPFRFVSKDLPAKIIYRY